MKYVDLAAGQIRITVFDNGAIRIDPETVTDAEALGYVEQKLEAYKCHVALLEKLATHYRRSVRLSKAIRECDL